MPSDTITPQELRAHFSESHPGWQCCRALVDLGATALEQTQIEVTRLRETNRLLVTDRDELNDALLGMVEQNCDSEDGKLDSLALTDNAYAMRLLARTGKLRILSEAGRRVIVVLAEAASPVTGEPE